MLLKLANTASALPAEASGSEAAFMTPAPDAARFAGAGKGNLDSLESRIWAQVQQVCSPSRKGRLSTLVKVNHRPHLQNACLPKEENVVRCRHAAAAAFGHAQLSDSVCIGCSAFCCIAQN